MFKAKSLFFISLLFIVLSSSRCKDCEKPRQILLPQEVLDFVDFKTGTYWVYQDSATGRIDSEVVISSRHFMDDVGEINECGSRHYENIEMLVKRYDTLGNEKYSWIRTFNNLPKMNNPDEDNVFIVTNSGSFLLGYPYSQTYDDHGYTVKEFLSDSIVYNGKIYYNILNQVEQFKNDNNFIINAFAKKIGRLFIGTTGSQPNQFQKVNLIRYKIM